MTAVTEASNRIPPIIVWDQAYNRTPTRTADGKLIPRTVVNAIRTYVDNKTLTGWVKQETLARDTGLTERQVKRHIADNVKAGWLKVKERGHSGGRANLYELTFPEEGTCMSPSGDAETQTTSKGGHTRPLNGDTYVTPTTPRTTPKSSSLTTNKNGDIDVPTSGDGTNDVPATASDFPPSATVTAKPTANRWVEKAGASALDGDGSDYDPFRTDPKWIESRKRFILERCQGMNLDRTVQALHSKFGHWDYWASLANGDLAEHVELIEES